MRRRKTRVILLSLLVLFVAIGVVFSHPLKVGYHKWRLLTNKREYARLRAGNYNHIDEFKWMLRGKPVLPEQHLKPWLEHAAALVKLGALQRMEFELRPMDEPTRQAFFSDLNAISRPCKWWTYQINPEGTHLIVIGCPIGLNLWQTAVGRLRVGERLASNYNIDCCQDLLRVASR